MRTRELWREAARNFGSGASRGVVSLVAFLALVLVVGIVAARGVVGVAEETAAFRDAGASAYHLVASGQIDGEACDNLASIDGIDASGATRSAGALRFALLPDLPTPSLDATPGMMRFVEAVPATLGAGLVIDAQLAESLGIRDVPAESYLVNSSSGTVVAGTFDHPDDGRDSSLSGVAIGVVADKRPFDSCWAAFWPPTRNPLDLLGPVVIGSRDRVVPELTQWNPTLGRTLDPQAAFGRLPLAGLTALAAAVAAVLAYVGARLRRLEFASALHVGVTRSSLVGVALAEVVFWIVPACMLAVTALAFASSWQNPDPPWAAWVAGARVVAVATGAWIVTVVITTATVRERHLVRYFQQR